MAESNATQVILTDDGLKIIKAQNTADNATGGVANLNDPNLMSVIEKQTAVSQYAGLTSQYNVILARAKDAKVSTDTLTTAYTNLNTFMAKLLTDTTNASNINRDTYKNLTDAYNMALSNVQTALSNDFNTDISSMQSSVSVASQAASSAVIVASQAATTGNNASQAASQAIVVANQAKSAGNNATSVANNATIIANSATSTADNALSQAQVVGSQASSEIAVQSTATVKAQSTADNAFSQATTALDNGNATSQAVTALKDGSTLTIAELGNGLATKVSNSEYASYKDQTASQIGEMVTDGTFSAYSQATAGLISSKVATSDFNTYKTQTATAISSKVESSDFNTYKTQTAGLISSKVSASDLNGGGRNYITNSANTITINGDVEHYKILYYNLTPGTWTFSANAKYTAGTATAVSVLVYDAGHSNQIGTNNVATLVNGRIQVTFKITDSSAKELLVYAGNNGYSSTTGNILQIDHCQLETGVVANDWSPAPEDTQSDITQTINNIQLGFKNPDGSNFQMNLSANGVALLDFSKIMLNGSTNITNGTIGTAQIGDAAITSAKIGKLAVGTAQIANAAITDAQVGNVSANKLTAGTIDFNMITGKNINASNITTGKLDTNRLNVGQLSALSADLGNVTAGSLKGVNIVAKTFSTPNGSFTTDASGSVVAKNMTLTGGTLTSPTINASTINGSTINGTTFNAGDIISSTYNTSQFYPTTITPAGLVATTGFNSMDGLRTEMSAGSFVTKYRAVHSNSNQYEAYDGVFSGDELALNSGFTNGIDVGFQQSVSGNQLTGQVVLSPLNGIHLWGSTQSIHFSGLQMNGTGITFNSYGNIIADPASTWWRVTSFSGHDIANFGTDTAGSNVIQFNRELDIGNFQINTGHTFISADGDAIHFAKGRGGAVDIYAGDVHYNSLVKSSLLSVKKDVQKADTSYWAQLVNSIDLATYQYKTDDNTSHLRLSSIVDDVNVTKQWQLPDVFISRDEDGKLCGVDDSVLLNATLATVQEQQKEIDKLNGHLLELEAKLNG